jgi:hypothetical protein
MVNLTNVNDSSEWYVQHVFITEGFAEAPQRSLGGASTDTSCLSRRHVRDLEILCFYLSGVVGTVKQIVRNNRCFLSNQHVNLI